MLVGLFCFVLFFIALIAFIAFVLFFIIVFFMSILSLHLEWEDRHLRERLESLVRWDRLVL